MSNLLSRLQAPALMLLAASMLLILLSGCVVPSNGYGYYGNNIGANYYEPYGFYYGNWWGPNYQVAPYRNVYYRRGYRGGSPHHAYRLAPESHSMPSIASGARSGGAHFGGSRSR